MSIDMTRLCNICGGVPHLTMLDGPTRPLGTIAGWCPKCGRLGPLREELPDACAAWDEDNSKPVVRMPDGTGAEYIRTHTERLVEYILHGAGRRIVPNAIYLAAWEIKHAWEPGMDGTPQEAPVEEGAEIAALNRQVAVLVAGLEAAACRLATANVVGAFESGEDLAEYLIEGHQNAHKALAKARRPEKAGVPTARRGGGGRE